MSKLADAMNRATRREARPIGFTATAIKPNPTMLLLARVSSATDAADAAANGADAVIVTSDDRLPRESTGDIFWGTGAPVSGRDAARSLREAGADFIVFDDATTDASVLLEEDLGFVMRIDLDASDTFLRTIDTLPVEALLAPSLEGALTVRRTLDLRRIAAFARKALVLPVPAAIDAAALEALRDTGVIAVVVDGASEVKVLRATIDALPPRRRAREAATSAVALPAGIGVTQIREPHEPEEQPEEPEEE